VTDSPPDPARGLHPAQRLLDAETLVLRRASSDARRQIAPQRAGKIDPNPHQIDAVVFALSRCRDGGCILADEVGLGKTIEAGLVIAQLLAEGASRILLVAPKPLLGQWKQELFQLFDIDAKDGEPRQGGFDGDGVFLIGREAAGSERGAAALLDARPFDLCVIDEAHEVFAGIYKRYDRFGDEKAESTEALTASRVQELLRRDATPVLLLTATPIQNSLTELWGLVQYVDGEKTLLGDLATFRAVFCGTDDRHLAPGQEEELKARLSTVVKRTLRRQAQEFLDKPFQKRHAKQFDYTMSVAERSLYDDVSRYLLEPQIAAFEGSHRHLLLTGFRRRMASSQRALAASLERVAERLREILAGGEPGADRKLVRELANDLEEDDDFEESPKAGAVVLREPEAVRAELARVEAFIARAHAVAAEDSKFRALLQALAFVTERQRAGDGSGKVVVFTESIATQEYLRDRLLESKLVRSDEITLFRGTNASPEAREALARWQALSPENKAVKPQIGVRLALVDEFRKRSRVFISTEAGAKGLNLQFCETVVNYDLPWNPQRIEQRIGRCHRYGQKHEVTVVNFIARDNEVEALLFDILSQKLELFGSVLDASDHVLHHADEEGSEALVGVLGADVEATLRRIWDRARTQEEVHAELRQLRDEIEENKRRFHETHARTRAVIETQLDRTVQQAFRGHQANLPATLAEFDQDILRVVRSYLDAERIPYSDTPLEGGRLLTIEPSASLPETVEEKDRIVAVGLTNHTSLHLGHSLVLAATASARKLTGPFSVEVTLPADALALLSERRGTRARLRLVKVGYDGFEHVELLVPVVCFEGGAGPLDVSTARALFAGQFRDVAPLGDLSVTDSDLDDALDELLFDLQSEIDVREQARYARAAQQAERFMEDRLLILRRQEQALGRSLEAAQDRRDAALGADRREAAERAVTELAVEIEELVARIQRLERREDEVFKRTQERLFAKRYRKPSIETLLQMELVIA